MLLTFLTVRNVSATVSQPQAFLKTLPTGSLQPAAGRDRVALLMAFYSVTFVLIQFLGFDFPQFAAIKYCVRS